MPSVEERRFHARRLRRASRNGGLLIVAQALGYFTGHLIGRGLHRANQFAHRPRKPFNLFGG